MPMLADSLKSLSSIMTTAAIFVAALHFGQDILVPIALAIILAFILAPIVRKLTDLRVPHAAAVSISIAAMVALFAVSSTIFSSQILSLAANLDTYKINLVEKVRFLTKSPGGQSTLSKAADAVEDLQKDVLNEFGDKTAPAAGERVVVAQGGDGRLAGIKDIVSAAGAPLAKIALTILFTFFLLLQHSDLRDRVIRIAGTDNMSHATAAMSEAGTRLSTLFLAQAALNAAFGTLVGIALWFIGVPNALLWGICAAVLRFVPFIGSLLAALPPLLLAGGAEPGWTMFLLTLSIYAIGEPFMGQIAEPLVLGKSSGLSPFAMIVVLSFWTLMWGPIGLILGVPITLAIVVLGRYVPGLEFLSVLLGDEPALTPQQSLYHRLLSKDSSAAIQQMETATANAPVSAASDSIVLPALTLASVDFRRERLDPGQIADLAETMQVMAGVFLEEEAAIARKPKPNGAPQVLVVGARGPIDRIASEYVAALLNAQSPCDCTALHQSSGLTALADARASVTTDNANVDIVIVTTAPEDSHQLRLVITRAASYFPDSAVYVVGAEQNNAEAGLSAGGLGVGGSGVYGGPLRATTSRPTAGAAGTWTKLAPLVELLSCQRAPSVSPPPAPSVPQRYVQAEHPAKAPSHSGIGLPQEA
ncbi:MAG: AI-2E family transporter [Hyphomicrobium sp.]